MLKDMRQVSRWYVLNQNFKIYSSCSACESENILYYKVRTSTHSGFAPECGNCGKEFPVRMRSTLNHKAPFQRNFSIDDESLGRIWEWPGLVK
jgi:transcription elongation factor Elf1